MTYDEIAEMMGVKIYKCGDKWGGTFGYTGINCDSSVNGFITKELLISKVVENRFGRDEIGRLVLKILLEHNPKEGGSDES